MSMPMPMQALSPEQHIPADSGQNEAEMDGVSGLSPAPFYSTPCGWPSLDFSVGQSRDGCLQGVINDFEILLHQFDLQ
jgi:hypothetical protein